MTIAYSNKKEHKVRVAQTSESFETHDNVTIIYEITHIENYGFASNLFNGYEVKGCVSNVTEVIEK